MAGRRLAASLVMLLAMGLAACGGDDAGKYSLVDEGTLTVCTDSPYFPMEFEEDGEYTGFDIELMRAIADDLSLELTVVNAGWDPIVSGLGMEAGDCDVGAASITILPDRAEDVTFSEPYFSGDQSLLVRKGEGLSSLADLAGMDIGVQSNTTGEIYANENDPGATIIGFENPGDLLLALTAGEVDAVLQDIVANAGEALQNDTVEVVETYTTDEFYGFAFQKTGKEELVEAINASLAKLRGNGTYDDIYSDWFE